MIVSVTSELEAVNYMLRLIKESPVATLDEVVGFPEANDALEMLRSVSRSMQAKGYHFNRKRNYKVTRDERGRCPLPANVMEVSRPAHAGGSLWLRDINVVWDAGTPFVFNATDDTFEWPTDIVVDMVVYHPFERLPEAARDYVATAAARAWAAAIEGSQYTAQLTEQDVYYAKATLENMECRVRRPNYVYDNFLGRRTGWRDRVL